MRTILFLSEAIDELKAYERGEPRLVFKVLELIQDIEKTPFTGKGKPEPLKGELQGYWSRRINAVHRLVYAVTDAEIRIFSCRSHYGQK